MTPDELIEAAAQAIEIAEVGYDLNLTELIDGKATYTLTYERGSAPLKFSSITDAHEHIAHTRAIARARAAASIFIEVSAKKAASFPAQDHGYLSTDPVEASRQTAQEISTSILALAPKPEG